MPFISSAKVSAITTPAGIASTVYVSVFASTVQKTWSPTISVKLSRPSHTGFCSTLKSVKL